MEVQNIASFNNSNNLERLHRDDDKNEKSNGLNRRYDGNWKALSQHKSNKKKHQLRSRWKTILKNEAPIKKFSKEEEWHSILKHELPKKNWTKEEDVHLIEAVERYGPRNWSLIAGHVKGRNGVSCRKRWVQQLDPNIKKTPWTDEENQIIIGAHRIWGNQWSRIARLLPGRTDNGIKNHWHVDLKFLCDQNVTTTPDEESSNNTSNCTALQKTISSNGLDESSSNSSEIHSPEQPLDIYHITKHIANIKEQEADTKLEESVNELKSSENILVDSSNEVNLSTLSTSPNQTLSSLSTLLSSLPRPEFSSVGLKSCNPFSNDSFSHSSIIQNDDKLDKHDSNVSCVMNKSNCDEPLPGLKKICASFSSIYKATSSQERISNSQQMQPENLQEGHVGSFGYMDAGLARLTQSLYNNIANKDSEMQYDSLGNNIRMKSLENLRNNFQMSHNNTSEHLETCRKDPDDQASSHPINTTSSHNPISSQTTAQEDLEHPQDIFNFSNNSYSTIISQLMKSQNESRSSNPPSNFLFHQLNSPLSSINDYYNRLTHLFQSNFNQAPVSYSEVMASETYKRSFPGRIPERNVNQNETSFTWGNIFHMMNSGISSQNSIYSVNGDIFSNKYSSNSVISPDKEENTDDGISQKSIYSMNGDSLSNKHSINSVMSPNQENDTGEDVAKDAASQESSVQSQNEHLSVTEFQRRLLDLILRAPDVLWKRKICWKLSEIVKLIDGIKEKEPTERNVSLDKNMEVLEKTKSTNNHRHLEQWKNSLNSIHQMKYNNHLERLNSNQDLNMIMENKKRKFIEDTEIIGQDSSHVEKETGSRDSRNHSSEVDHPKNELSTLHNISNGNIEKATSKCKQQQLSSAQMPNSYDKISSLDMILNHKNICVNSEQKMEESKNMPSLKSSLSYRCSKCPSLTFRGKNDLRRHLYVHSGKKPFTCEVCGRGFIRRDHKIKHLLKHHWMKNTANKNIERLNDGHDMNTIRNISDDSIDSNMDLVLTDNQNNNDSNNNNNNNNDDNNNNNNNDNNNNNNDTNNDDNSNNNDNNSNDDNTPSPDDVLSHLDPEYDENDLDVNLRLHCKSETKFLDNKLNDTPQNNNESRIKNADSKKNMTSLSVKCNENIDNGKVSNVDANSNDSFENEVVVNTKIENDFHEIEIPKPRNESNENMNFKEFVRVEKNELGIVINSKNSVESIKEADKNFDKFIKSYDEIESDMQKVVSNNATNSLDPQAISQEDIVSQIKVLKYIQKMPELGLLTTAENI